MFIVILFVFIVAPVVTDVQLIDTLPANNRAGNQKTLECRIPYSKPRANVTWQISDDPSVTGFTTIDSTWADFQSSVVVVVCYSLRYSLLITSYLTGQTRLSCIASISWTNWRAASLVEVWPN